MFFTVIEQRIRGSAEPATAYLVVDHWDDWFSFETMFSLIVVDEEGNLHEPGSVKIGQRGLRPRGRTFIDGISERVPGSRYPEIPREFDELSDDFFSLGQDETYYETLNSLSDGLRERVLLGLRDVALDLERFAEVENEAVATTSLLRSVRPRTVRGRLHRLAQGDARLTQFHFQYTLPAGSGEVEQPTLTFDVIPETQPPTNVHVLIGRNGAGKTRFMRGLSQALLDRENLDGSVGSVEIISDEKDDWTFTGLVFISFSAFDDFVLDVRQDDPIRAVQVGLRQLLETDRGFVPVTRNPEELATDFVSSLEKCRTGLRAARWIRAVETLEADDLFAEAEVRALLDADDDGWRAAAERLFGLLSSGHAIVLLTITRLVELVDERTLVLLDEPEAHLHPPLLSAFVRSLSDLLVSRNGVAIISTHSPVVLQEVPKSCTWKVRRSGAETRVDRPEQETFAENVSVLTREVFGLEVTKAGFHRLIQQAVLNPGARYEDIVTIFGSQLGAEGKALAKALVGERDQGGQA